MGPNHFVSWQVAYKQQATMSVEDRRKMEEQVSKLEHQKKLLEDQIQANKQTWEAKSRDAQSSAQASRNAHLSFIQV